jgi:CheY-like chemotaxis protein
VPARRLYLVKTRQLMPYDDNYISTTYHINLKLMLMQRRDWCYNRPVIAKIFPPRCDANLSSHRQTKMSGRILIVEDDSIIRTNISELLRKEGYQVEEAGDGFQALEVLETQRFDLVITDFAMRRVNGLTLVERIHTSSPETPVIVITGYISGSTGKALLKDKAEFIRKPIKFEELLSTVKRLLQPPV